MRRATRRLRGEDGLMSSSGILVVVSGPSGVGKSTLCDTIVKHVPQTMLSVSCTTRPPRAGEQDGVEYRFVEAAQFQTMMREDAFVEWAEVYGYSYGTPKRPLAEAMERGVNVLLDIDTQGAKQIMERFAGAVLVFVTPPSIDVLKERLHCRALDGEDAIRRRLQRASEEIAHFEDYHYLIRNEHLPQAAKELESIILAERVRVSRLNVNWLADSGLLEQSSMKEIAT